MVVPVSAGAVVAGACGVTAVPVLSLAGAIGVVVVSAGAGLVTAGVLFTVVLVDGCELAEKTR